MDKDRDMKKIFLIIQDAGGGHRASAMALVQAAKDKRYNWDFSIISGTKDILNERGGEVLYNFLLKKRLEILFWPFAVPVIKSYIRLKHSAGVRKFRNFWMKEKPDLVISLTTFINRALCDSLKSTALEGSFITVLTDLADTPPGFWIENVDQTLVVATERAKEQALELGLKESQIHRISGLMIHPRYYKEYTCEQLCSFKKQRGLSPSLPIFLVMFGGMGSPLMIPVLKVLNRLNENFQVVCICGNNLALQEKINSLRFNYSLVTEGFTSDIPQYMAVSQCYIGKAGPGTLSEAEKMNLPVITFKSLNKLRHESYNLKWLEETGRGRILNSVKSLPSALKKYFFNNAKKTSLAESDNEGVYEVCNLIATKLMETEKEIVPALQKSSV